MKSLKDCTEGDIIMHSGGNKYKVLGRLNRLVFLSESYDHHLAHYHPFTIDQLIKENWKLLTPDGKEPIERKEAERLLGNVEII